MIDLHIHTTYSDGQYSPSEIVNMAQNKGIRLISITDHDTLSGIEEGKIAAAACALPFIPGIEISANGNSELHILGYGIDDKNPDLIRMTEDFQLLREKRADRIILFLKERGVIIDINEVLKHTAGGHAGRSHFARAMVEAGYVSSVQEAFERFLATDEFSAIDRVKPEPEDCIAAITNAGGAAVLAHPLRLGLENETLEALLKRLVAAGLCGIECYYSSHNSKQREFYLSLAEKYNLLVTGGSDYHGEKVKPSIELGSGIDNSLCFEDSSFLEELDRKRGIV